MILILNDRTSSSKKINGMALIRTLTVSTTALERTKERFCGFRQTVQFFLQLVSQRWKKKSIASFRSYVTCCNLGLQIGRSENKTLTKVSSYENEVRPEVDMTEVIFDVCER